METKLSSTQHLGDDNSPARLLPAEYKSAGNTYKQILRGQKAVVYECIDPETGSTIHEVFMIKIRAAGVIKGTPIPKREVVPGDGDFGMWAWCYGNNSKHLAIARYESIEAGEVVEVIAKDLVEHE